MSLPTFDNALAERLVKKALKEVADFPDNANISSFSFQHFNDFHKLLFASALKKEVISIKDGSSHYDVVLNPNIINNWSTVQDCINYLVNNQQMMFRNTSKVQL